MIYNFNLGIGWASSGVEYAQVYRAKMFRNLNKKAKFIFTDMFPQENIEHMTKNIGFLDSEIIWLYSYFTDFSIAPVTFSLSDLEKTITKENYQYSRNGKICMYVFEGKNNYYRVFMTDENSDYVHRVEIVSNGYLIRKDYYTYAKLYSEYYAPFENKAHLYKRSFFNEDGTLAYDEILDGEGSVYKFKDRILYSKEEFVGYLVEKLNLTDKDTVIIDRTTGIGQSILMNAAQANVGIVVHADHYSENNTNEDNILWNNYYEYAFRMNKYIDFYITATDTQNQLMKEQFKKYKGICPTIHTIPVGSIHTLQYPEKERKPYSLITASRLATEKHIDWIIKAVIEAKKRVPQLSLDIYGQGVEKIKLENLIKEFNAMDYICLMGQHDLTAVYRDYEGYISASTSEGFGLTLMEAVGSGLPIIGFDVRYGNPTFIDQEKNGYLIPMGNLESEKDKVLALADKIVEMFTSADINAFHEHSYEIAKNYLTESVQQKWRKLLYDRE